MVVNRSLVYEHPYKGILGSHFKNYLYILTVSLEMFLDISVSLKTEWLRGGQG